MKRKKFSCYCILLRRATNYITKLYDRHLKIYGLTVTQYSLLSNIQELKCCSVSELAIYVDLERTTLVRTLKPLMESNLIDDISPENARNRMITITEKGEAVLEQAKAAWQCAQEEVEQLIGKEDLAVIERVLLKLSL